MVAVLKEVKYLGLLKKSDIPPEATTIYNQNNQYRRFITSLDYTVDSYNKILKNASPEEKPLIQDDLNKIDAELENAEKNLKWKSPGIDEYISNNQNKVSNLEQRLQKSKSNLEKIKTLMNTWQGNPLFKRHEQKSTLLQLEDKQVRLDNRYKEINETGIQIHELANVITLTKLSKSHYLRKYCFNRKIKHSLELKMKILICGRYTQSMWIN